MVYEIKKQDHILTENLQLQLKLAGKQLVGFGLIAASVVLGLALVTYSPADPSLFTATDRPVNNWIGSHGAMVASALIVVFGLGSWTLVVHLAMWGTRFLLNRNAGRFLLSFLMIPPAMLLASALAATGPTGLFAFNPGGLVGDVAYSGLLYAWWGEPAAAQRVLSLWVGGFTLLFGLSMLGFPIFRTLGHWLTLPLRALRPKPSKVEKKDSVKFAGSAEHSTHASHFDQQSDLDNHSKSEQGPTLRSRESAEPGSRRILRGFPSLFGALARRRKPDSEEALDGQARTSPKLGGSKVPSEAGTGAKTRKIPGFEGVAPVAPVTATPSAKTRVVAPARRRKLVSRKARKERQPSLGMDEADFEYEGPPFRLLQDPKQAWVARESTEALEQNARMLESVLEDYGVKGKIGMVRPGPVVTLYQLEPAPGVKTSRVIGLSDDIARSMAALSARISTVPGESYIGIELPNDNRETVFLRELVSLRQFGDSRDDLVIALGKNISGDPIFVDLAKMPHLLIAGTTGSGKSVAINTMILSLIYRLGPDKCRLIMIDPKMLELSVYDGIPHLLSPVVTDPKKAVVALKWVVAEMEERYRNMSKLNVRNIVSYNDRMRRMKARGECCVRRAQTGVDKETGKAIYETEKQAAQPLPYIVVIVDEMADLMMVAGREIEACVQRLAQMARAAGIHIIMATQRPSVDVITGTIKSNFPARVSFQVSSKIDSRTILNEQGAEQLLGMGDMLYMAGGSKIERVHGPFVSDREVEEISSFLKSLGRPNYVAGVIEGPDKQSEDEIDAVLGLGKSGNAEDEAYEKAVSVMLRDRRVSVSYIQRKLSIGYNKAARLVERMEEQGLVSKANHVGKREILVPE